MSETVLQSFCERCGTRYTSTVPETKPAAEEGRGVLARFGRRSSREKPPEPEPTPSSTDPSSDHFAGTFHFCMDCRQYTCSKCWNAEGGACLSCQPRSQPGATPAGGTSSPKPFAARASSAWTANRTSGADESVQPPAASTGDTTAASTGDSPAAGLFGAPAGEVDPWRGVVFSSVLGMKYWKTLIGIFTGSFLGNIILALGVDVFQDTFAEVVKNPMVTVTIILILILLIWVINVLMVKAMKELAEEAKKQKALAAVASAVKIHNYDMKKIDLRIMLDDKLTYQKH